MFNLVICVIHNYCQRYYTTSSFLHRQCHGLTTIQSDFPSSSDVNSNDLTLMTDGIQLDMKVFEYYLREKSEKLSVFLEERSFGVGVFFGERMLCLFGDFFNNELLFRVWDYLFIEGSSKNLLKITYFGMAVMVNFFCKNSVNIMLVCVTLHDIHLYLSLAAKFDVDCDTFLEESIHLYTTFIKNDPVKFPSTSSLTKLSSTDIAFEKTKKIFNSLVNVSKNIFHTTLHKHLVTINSAYSQLHMHKSLN